MTTKWTYMFKEGTAEGDASMLELLGMKGANLAQMSKLGLPVPAGFTVAANACERFLNSNQEIEPSLKQAILVSMNELSGHALSGDAKIEFGSSQNPLLVSVRSGSAVSMPGVMNSILNVGLNDESVEALAKQTNDPRFAYDTYRRFIQTYGEIVLEIELADFEEILDSTKAKSDWELDTDITANGWKEIIAEFKALVLQETEAPFPQDPFDQLFSALSAVFSSWNSTRAKMYRTLHGISELHGTAVTIQTMVFGNKGCDSAAGSSLTRDPSNGNKMLYGEYLANAQGEDVSAGMRMPHYISTSSSTDDGHENTLEVKMPKAFEQLEKAAELLEASFKQMQDIEFTIQEGALWLLQTSPAKHSALAGIKIAVDMVEAGIQSKQEAIAKIDASSLTQLLHPSLAENAQRDVLVNGLAASPGAATGAVVFNSTEAEALSNDGKNVILVRAETSPDDIHGMVAAQGILTQRGGTTSHAAVIARGMGKPCVSGASTMRINLEEQELRVGKRVIRRGEVITLDGDQGQVLVGEHEMVQPELSGSFAILMQWADEFRRMKVRSNAEKATDAKLSTAFGAEGIGLCRTEHMFFEGERIVAVREMILAKNEEGRRIALSKLLPMQRQDFYDLFEIMAGRPLNIRLLDPPLHEFLPQTAVEMERVAIAMGISVERLKRRAQDLKEVNPMLGLRGCRLAISYPEIAEMQTRAIFEAAADLFNKTGISPEIEIMVPLVSLSREYKFVHKTIMNIANEVMAKTKVQLEYSVGTMIELPRAALRGDELAKSAEFFSFGTNDLTQTTFGISRDDSPQFLQRYQAGKIVDQDPFAKIDELGVGNLMEIAMERGGSTNPKLKFGACGEHAGDPTSIDFFERIKMDYISCSPYRVPIARLAAAQAALKYKKN